MSQLAKKLPAPETVATRIRRGPTGECDIYGDGDLEDWRAVQNLRRQTSWAIAQRAVDEALGLSKRIDNDKFRRHFRMKCWHWTQDQRDVAEAES